MNLELLVEVREVFREDKMLIFEFECEKECMECFDVMKDGMDWIKI